VQFTTKALKVSCFHEFGKQWSLNAAIIMFTVIWMAFLGSTYKISFCILPCLAALQVTRASVCHYRSGILVGLVE
jgi:hypothetical protein